MTITITITGDARTVRDELATLISANAIPAVYRPGPDSWSTEPKVDVDPVIEQKRQADDYKAEAEDAAEAKAVSGEILPPDDKPKRGRGRPKATEPERQLSGVAAEYQAALAAEQTPMSAAEAEKVMAADAVGQAPETPPETTLADVQNAIRDVAMRFDTEACKQILQLFGAGKSSEVKPEDRADFVKAAKEFKR